MPLTPIYGLPYEHEDDQPLHSLTGGSSGTEPILAEEVEDELSRIDSDIQDVADAAEEAGLGWVPITEGEGSSLSNLDIDLTDSGRFPAGTFHEIEITLNGNQDATETIIARVNNDSTAGLHRAGFVTWALSDGSVADSESNTITNRWKLGQWLNLSGGTCRILIQRTNESSNLPMQATTTSPASSYAVATGRLESNRLIDAIRIGHEAGGVTFSTIRWTVRGYRIAEESTS